jgi:hypothetical protein
MASSHKFSLQTKHIALKYHHFRQHVKSRRITISYCQTNEQKADMLTKPLSDDLFLSFDIWSVAGKFFLLIAILQGRGGRFVACALSRGSVTKDETQLVASSNTCYLLVGGKSNSVSFPPFFLPFSCLPLARRDRQTSHHPSSTNWNMVLANCLPWKHH